MLQLVITILVISFLLYTLLGGADFGAGIIEIFVGRKGEKTVSSAIAPVWEANHVWLILAIVIIFTGFPLVYSTLSLYLHIPLMIALMGIVLRGSSFIFRYYDVKNQHLHNYFTAFFKLSSFITPFFLGVVFGAMMLGRISLLNEGSFFERFVHPWLNLFCCGMGLFVTALFGYIAATFLVAEAKHAAEQKTYTRLSKLFLILTFAFGVFLFVAAELENRDLFNHLTRSPFGIAIFCCAALLIPVIFYLFNRPVIIYLRAVISIQVTLLLSGWFIFNYPVLMYEKNGNHLTFVNTQAPAATLYQLVIALFIGLLLIFPSFYFLFKVFKKADDKKS
jgi:cytochrome d ubiquinol oxidase subunit II